MSIYFCTESKVFYLESKNTTYAMRVNEEGYLEHLYYGARIGRDDLSYNIDRDPRCFSNASPDSDNGHCSLTTICLESPFYGNGDFRECMIQVEHKTGTRICNLKYQEHKILNTKPNLQGMPSVKGGETLVITLKDTYYNLYVDLFYTVFEDEATLLRHMEIRNEEADTIKILRAYSFSIDLQRNDYEAITLTGAWARERQIERTPLHHGNFVVDSKRGSSSAILNPFIAIVSKDTTEEFGDAYGINLVYSSSWVLKAQCPQDGTTRVLGGINDFDFEWKLNSKEKFTTPEAVLVYSNKGLGEMSRTFHDTYRKYLINERFVKAKRPIVINNWEATYFDFTNEKLMAIMDAVAGTGIDTFVLDDGWFGTRVNDDKHGLGDWVVNTDKVKGGLKTVIDHCHKLGMKFGLWFEPEMANPDSVVCKNHPDWVIRSKEYFPVTSRTQWILDITRPEVRDYIYDAISKVLRENEIDYVKWDSNRNMTENCSLALPAENQKEYHHRYALALYELCERLVNGFPNIIFEGCSGGGARFDGAMLHYFPQIWTSDDSDGYMRTKIQYGTSMCYPLSSMSCHTSICPNHQTGRTVPFKTRADIAHLGATGYELDTTKMTEEERVEVPKQVAEYKAMEDLVLEGDLYRIENPFESNYFGFTLVSKDKKNAHITFMRNISIPGDETKRIYPRGLDEDKTYFVKELDRKLLGRTIMNAGIMVKVKEGDFRTLTFTLKEV